MRNSDLQIRGGGGGWGGGGGGVGGAYLSTFRNFHGGDSARIDVFDPFFGRLSALGKSLGISMGETFFILSSRLRHNKLSFQELLTV